MEKTESVVKQEFNILGFSGSLRKNSYNTAALRAAKVLAPAGINVNIFDLASIPLYNQDLEEGELPAGVAAFKQQIALADALLIVTPEYNYSVPGVLKNALDWASRPSGQSPLSDKPVAIMGASMGYFGTSRAQYHLRQTCVILNMHPLNNPEVFIPGAANKFDQDGNLTDAYTQENIKKLLVALKAWAERLQSN